jgi:hypothetical protein
MPLMEENNCPFISGRESFDLNSLLFFRSPVFFSLEPDRLVLAQISAVKHDILSFQSLPVFALLAVVRNLSLPHHP